MNQVEYERQAEIYPFWEISPEPDDPECKHPLPGDWDFGVPTNDPGGDARVDPRWQPITFMYLDEKMKRIAITQVPRCRHEAIGSYKNLIEKQKGRTVYYVTGALPGEAAEILYSNVDGAIGANQG